MHSLRSEDKVAPGRWLPPLCFVVHANWCAVGRTSIGRREKVVFPGESGLPACLGFALRTEQMELLKVAFSLSLSLPCLGGLRRSFSR